MRKVMSATCKFNIFKQTDFKRGPISANDVKSSLDRLKARDAMECVTKDGYGGNLDHVTGPLRNGKYFECTIDLIWHCNPSLSTSQYFQTAIALVDLAYTDTKANDAKGILPGGSSREHHLGPSQEWHGQDAHWADMTRMHEAVYVPLIDAKETLEMMKNNPDLIQSFHGTTALRAVDIAQNGYKGG